MPIVNVLLRLSLLYLCSYLILWMLRCLIYLKIYLIVPLLKDIWVVRRFPAAVNVLECLCSLLCIWELAGGLQLESMGQSMHKIGRASCRERV